jgi:hypothetical protein
MWFNFFKHKKEEEPPKTFEGRFISEDEIKEMTRPKKGTFIKKEFDEIEELMKTVRQYVD